MNVRQREWWLLAASLGVLIAGLVSIPSVNDDTGTTSRASGRPSPSASPSPAVDQVLTDVSGIRVSTLAAGSHQLFVTATYSSQDPLTSATLAGAGLVTPLVLLITPSGASNGQLSGRVPLQCAVVRAGHLSTGRLVLVVQHAGKPSTVEFSIGVERMAKAAASACSARVTPGTAPTTPTRGS